MFGDMKKIHWLIGHPLAQNFSPSELHQHNLASVRLRAGALSKYTQVNRGIIEVMLGESVDWTDLDAIVVGKIGADNTSGRFEQWLRVLTKAISLGVPILLDYTDDHLSARTAMTSFYQEALNLANGFVVSSDYLRLHLSSRVTNPIFVVEDAVEYDPEAPKNNLSGACPSLLWFGHPSNIVGLIDGLSRLKHPNQFCLNLITNDVGRSLLSQASFNWSRFNKTTVFPWSVDALPIVAKASDIVIIPMDRASTRKRGVSENRLVTSLTLGLPVFSDPIDSYQVLSEYFLEFDKLCGGWSPEYAVEGRGRVVRAQKQVCPSFEMVRVGGLWADILSGFGQQ